MKHKKEDRNDISWCVLIVVFALLLTDSDNMYRCQRVQSSPQFEDKYLPVNHFRIIL